MSIPADRTPPATTPSRVSVAALLRWTFVALVLTAGVLSGAMVLVNRMEWWQGFVAASVIAVPAAVVGLFPVVLLAARGNAAQVAYGFLAGTMLRMMTAMALLLVATHAYGAPRFSTALIVLAYYGAMLVAEVTVLVGQMRRAFPVNLKQTSVAVA